MIGAIAIAVDVGPELAQAEERLQVCLSMNEVGGGAECSSLICRAAALCGARSDRCKQAQI